MDAVFDEIGKEDIGEIALQILHVISFFGQDDIDKGMFSSLISKSEDLERVFQLLNRHSLVERLSNGTVIRINSETRTRIRRHLKEQNKEEAALSLAVELLNLNLKNVGNFSHAMCVFEHSKEYPRNIELMETSIGMCSHVIIGLMDQSKYSEAISFGHNVLDFAKSTLGEHHSQTLIILHNMATVFTAEGKYEKAVKLLWPLYEKSVQFSDQSAITPTLISLANVLSASSRYEEAKVIYEKLLGTSSVYDARDKMMLTAWHDYAVVLSDTGSTEKALKILREVLEMRSIILNPNDDNIRSSRLSIGHSLLKLNKNEEALEIFQNVYEDRRAHLGEDHKATLKTQSDVALALQRLGDYDKAIPAFNVVIEKCKRVLGDLHLYTLNARSNLASVFLLQSKYEEACQIYTDVYHKMRKVYEEDQLDVLKVKHHFGLTLLHLNKIFEASRLFQEVLQGYCKVFGPDHSETKEVKRQVDTLKFVCMVESTKSETLHSLSREGNLDKVVSLIQNGEDVNVTDANGKSPLHYAAQFGHVKLVKFLLEKGAAYNIENKKKETPLQLAKSEEVKELLNSVKILFEGVKTGNYERGREFLQKAKCLANARESAGYTLLHWAALKGHKPFLRLLLECGADVNLVSTKGNSSLHTAVSQGDVEAVEILLQSVGSDKLSNFINGRTKIQGNSPLHVAAERGYTNLVKTLLKNGAIHDIRNRDDKTPLEVAKEWGVCNLLKLIDLVFKDAKSGSASIIEKLRDIDQDDLLAIKNTRDQRNCTLLQIVVDNKHQEIARKLQKILKDPTINS